MCNVFLMVWVAARVYRDNRKSGAARHFCLDGRARSSALDYARTR